MKQSYLASILGALLLFTFSATQVAAECCVDHNGGYCEDGTEATPCCGYGPCNVFCCNCDGGCRTSFRDHELDFAAFRVDHGGEDIDCRSKFTLADADGDGKMNFAEWVVSTLDASELKPITDRWLKFDHEGKGYMTEEEAFERTAA